MRVRAHVLITRPILDDKIECAAPLPNHYERCDTRCDGSVESVDIMAVCGRIHVSHHAVKGCLSNLVLKLGCCARRYRT